MQSQFDPGLVLGDYEIMALAGTGGMGVVYRARQRSLGRQVALKVIGPDLAEDPGYRQRFLREARLAASVDHPHVVTVYDAREVGGQLILAMQWIEGQDLQKLLGLAGRLTAERAVPMITQLAGALDAVHAAGLIHRDVKPANVLVRRIGDQDHVYLTDFGVARPADLVSGLTRAGSVMGTAGYLAPEQIRGAAPDTRSDLICMRSGACSTKPSPGRGRSKRTTKWRCDGRTPTILDLPCPQRCRPEMSASTRSSHARSPSIPRSGSRRGAPSRVPWSPPTNSDRTHGPWSSPSQPTPRSHIRSRRSLLSRRLTSVPGVRIRERPTDT